MRVRVLWLRRDLHQLHHSPILVREDVAMEHELIGVVDEAAAAS
jgi:hypothetical protein